MMHSAEEDQHLPSITLSKWYSFHNHRYAYISPPQTLMTDYGVRVNMFSKDDGYVLIIHPNDEVVAFCEKIERSLGIGGQQQQLVQQQSTASSNSNSDGSSVAPIFVNARDKMPAIFGSNKKRMPEMEVLKKLPWIVPVRIVLQAVRVTSSNKIKYEVKQMLLLTDPLMEDDDHCMF